MRLAVLLVSYNTAEATGRCLASLKGTGGIAEVVVVDNASTDDSLVVIGAQAEVLRRAGIAVQVRRLAQNCGFSRAVNLAAAQSQAPGLMLLNSDAQLPAGVGGRWAAALQRAPTLAAVAPRQVDECGRWQLSWGPEVGYCSEAVRRVLQRRIDAGGRLMRRGLDLALRRPRSVAWAAASALAVRRQAFFAVGGFDERFFLFFEDIDFCVRLRAAGGQVLYDPRLTLMHARGLSCAAAPLQAQDAYRRSQAYYWQKHHGRLHGRAMAAWVAWQQRRLGRVQTC